MPCSICKNIGHNKRTCPSVRPSAANEEDCYSSDEEESTGVEMWTHPKSGKIYLRDPALEDGQHDLFDYEEFLESGDAYHIGWFTPSTGEITFDGEENKVEYETEDEQISDEPDEDEPSQEELWDGDVPEDFGWTEAELDGRKMTYTTDSGEEVPIYWDDCDTRYRCDCKGKNYIYIISEEKMEEMHEKHGHRWGPHKWDFRPSWNFFDEPDSTGPSVKTDWCGQKFCCGELYHEVMADQFAYRCDEHDCGCSHPIHYFEYGEGCDACEDPGEHINGVCIETSN